MAIGNIALVALLFCYVPASYLILIASIPAIIYSLYTRKFFLLFFCGLVFLLLLFIFLSGMWFQEQLLIFLKSVNILAYIFVRIYPYGLHVNLLDMVSLEQLSLLLFYLGLFVFFVLLCSLPLKISNISVMLNFSYFVITFSSIYLIVNVFCFVFRPLETLIFSIPWISWIFVFLYFIIPFLSLVFIFQYIELTILDLGEHQKDVRTIEKHKTKKSVILRKIVKGLVVVMVIMFIVIALLGFGSV